MKFGFRDVVASWLFSLLLGLVLLFTASIYPQAALADDFTKATLVNADFAGKDLTTYEFTQTSVRNGKFANANLTGVSLIGGNFDAADMTGVNMTNASLDTARLTHTNLTNAILVGAFVTDTNFNGAIIDGADFTDVMFRKDVKIKLCAIATGTNPTTGRVTKDTLECP